MDVQLGLSCILLQNFSIASLKPLLAFFKMQNIVAGPKKAGQEAQAVIDSRTGELVVAGSAIRKASLEYCLDTLE